MLLCGIVNRPETQVATCCMGLQHVACRSPVTANLKAFPTGSVRQKALIQVAGSAGHLIDMVLHVMCDPKGVCV
jgi:hypothetical protein